MKVSKAATSTARRIFRLCLENGEINEANLRTVIKKIGEDKPRDYRGILQVLKRLVQAEMAKKQVTVESAVELAPPAKGEITKALKAKHGQDLNFDYQVNSDLIGGLRIRIGDNVYDSSVKSRLDRLATSF